MATADEYAAWIVKNADKKGTPEFDTVAAAYQAARTTPDPAPAAPPVKPELSGLANAWDGTKNFGLGLAKGVMAPIDGGAQLLGEGMSAAAHKIAPGTAVDRWFASESQRVNDINTDRENKYQAMTPGSVAAGVGNVIGQVAVPLKGTQLVRAPALAADATAGMRALALAQKLGQAGKAGAIIGAAQPVYGAGERSLTGLVREDGAPVDYWKEKAKQVGLGAALGGTFSALGSVGGAGYNALRPLVAPGSAAGDRILGGLQKASNSGAPVVEDMAALAGSKAPADVLARVRAAAPIVEGSLPTTAQVAGVPELVMAEKVLKNNPAYRGKFEDRAISNNQARLAQLLSVAKTPQELEAAIAARAATTKPMYEAARAATLPADDALHALLGRPSSQQAIARGMQLAAERGEQVGLQAPTPAAARASSILDANGRPFQEVVPAQAGEISGNMLQYLKMGLDDMQSTGRVQGIGAHEARALEETQGALQGWVEKNSPDFLRANQAYAAASQPINSMQAGQAISDGLKNGVLNASGDVAPMLSQYRTQLAKALKNSPYGIEPQAEKSLAAIQSDLQRETISNSIRSAGSDTAFNLQAPNWLSGQLFGNAMDGKSVLGKAGATLGGFMTGGPMGAAGGYMGAQKLGEFAGNSVNDRFQRAMLEPEYFAKLLAEALDRQSGNPALLQKLAPVGTRGATVGAENTMAPGP